MSMVKSSVGSKLLKCEKSDERIKSSDFEKSSVSVLSVVLVKSPVFEKKTMKWKNVDWLKSNDCEYFSEYVKDSVLVK